MKSKNTYQSRKELVVDDKKYHYFNLNALEKEHPQIKVLPYSLKILLENLLRHEDQHTVSTSDIEALLKWPEKRTSDHEIAYRPARVLMQDFTGVPAIVDLAAMRDAICSMGGKAAQINPLSPVDLVIDHSIQVDAFGSMDAIDINSHMDMERNHERYTFLRWGQDAFSDFQVVPPATGICHQVNLEYLAKTVWTKAVDDEYYVYPDTLVGTDSHTTMVNGLGVLGWGVGGIEAEAAMLGQPISMLIPEVIGVKLSGNLREGVTATDLVLTLTNLLRKKGVVGKFVEYVGSGLKDLSVADRATIANMSPEYGATCGFFPIDQSTLDYLQLTGREEHTIRLVEQYAKIQGLWYDAEQGDPTYTDILELDLATVEPCLAGPKRPQDRVAIDQIKPVFDALLADSNRLSEIDQSYPTQEQMNLHHGDVVIAAITSCTNTSNPSVLMAAGLVAKKALEKGLKTKPWVKTSLAPGSKVVTQYLQESGLQACLDQLGFQLVGYGCTTCIGNSGPLSDPIAEVINEHDLVMSSVLSGNRNFEGRIHPQVKANWLASPPLVVLYALAGTTRINLYTDAIGNDHQGNPVYMRDIWPTNAEIKTMVNNVQRSMFQLQYKDVFTGPPEWQQIEVKSSDTYDWQANSTYIQNPPYFENMPQHPKPVTDILQARILALFGDSITTDHISPAGSIKADSPAGRYLQSLNVQPRDFNSYGARRGNHQVMMRGTFANIRIRNEMVPGIEGGMTKHFPSEEILSIYDAAMRYQQEKSPLIIIAGKEYGTGSSRDWAAKGPKLQGIQVVIAESFERIHRSNLIGMGILPLEFMSGENRKTLFLKGDERFDFQNLSALSPRGEVGAVLHRNDGSTQHVRFQCRIDTQNELLYYQHGGILHYVLRGMLKN